MRYECIPYWMEGRDIDHFDYPLRKKEDVYYQMFLFPVSPYCQIERFICQEKAFLTSTANNYQYEKCKFYVDLTQLVLFPNQLERLIFLLGPRYKNDMIFKLSINEAPTFEGNVGIANQMFKEIILESLRAPVRLYNKSITEQEILLKSYGGVKQYDKIISFLEDKTTPQYKKFLEFYPKMTSIDLEFREKHNLNEEILKINETLFDEKSLKVFYPEMSNETIQEYMINKEKANSLEKEKDKKEIKIDNTNVFKSLFKSKQKVIEEQFKDKLNPKAFELLKSSLI